jgi:hypothetical protein
VGELVETLLGGLEIARVLLEPGEGDLLEEAPEDQCIELVAQVLRGRLPVDLGDGGEALAQGLVGGEDLGGEPGDLVGRRLEPAAGFGETGLEVGLLRIGGRSSRKVRSRIRASSSSERSGGRGSAPRGGRDACPPEVVAVGDPGRAFSGLAFPCRRLRMSVTGALA